MEPKEIPLHEGMMIMDEAIVKAKKIMQGYPETKFTTEEYTRFYECVYFMCTYHASDHKKLQLYEKFRLSLEDSIFSTVLPSLMTKERGAPLLRELVIIWSNYKLMARWLSRFFEYLDRFFIPQSMTLLSLNDLSVCCFKDLVFKKLYYIFKEAVMSMIKQERQGFQIDGELLKNVLNIFAEIEHFMGKSYYDEFERVMLIDTSAYYYRLAYEWLSYDSLADYVQKVFWCLREESKRASRYMRPGTEVKLVQVVKSQLLEKTATKLMEKRQAEMCGVMTDYQDILSKCASMNLDEGSSATPEEWLSNLMASSAHIR